MELQLHGSDWNLRISNYSIVGNLLYNVVAMTSPRELSPWEKLYVAKSSGRSDVHAGYLADVYLNCGCFAPAREHYSRPEHPRKLGDICWAEGDLQQAEAFYLKVKSEAQSYRNSPDDDRLIKLAFFQERWDRVVERFCGGCFSRGFSPGAICIGSSETSAQPYLDMLAVALTRLAAPAPARALEILDHSFEISAKTWTRLASDPRYAQDKMIAKLKNRCRPRVGAAESLTIEQALRKGATPRARHVHNYIQHADESLVRAQEALARFADTGDDAELDSFIAEVTGSGIISMSHTFLFAALGHDSFPGREVPPERLVRLFSRHPVMNKRHFGKLLDLRFTHRLPLTGDDILTGLFQSLGRSAFSLSKSKAEPFDLPRLASCREWARVRLDEWIRKRGSAGADKVAGIWREGRAQPAAHPFYPGVVEPPESPRNMKEWNDLMATACAWLHAAWTREIGNSRWIAENQLFQILRRLLKGIEVQQHARPTWLEPQHLDVYIPSAGIAVEYMGRQHFEPLEFFGGTDAFRQLVERDRKKAELCRSNGVELIRVRFDEDVGPRARSIAERIAAATES